MSFDGASEGRRLFGGTAADVAETDTGARVAGAVGTVYSVGTDTVVTDLKDNVDGTPMTELVADSRGMIAEFWGPPDGTDEIEVDFGNGRVVLRAVDTSSILTKHQTDADPHGDRAYTDLIAAQLSAQIQTPDDQSAQIQGLQADVTALQTVVAGVPMYVLYDETNNVWPLRPTAASTRIVLWVGPMSNPPQQGNGYMSSRDLFFGWS